jgi:hypothetical protein
MYRCFVPCHWRCQATADPSWLGPPVLLVLAAWGFGVLLLLFPLLATGTLLALPFVTGIIDFGVRHYRLCRMRPVHRAAERYSDLVPLRIQDETPGDRRLQGEHVLVVTRRQTHIHDN